MSQFDFSHLTAEATVKVDRTREYEFTELKGSPKLFCLPATDENKSYRDDRLSRINKRRKSLRKGVEITAQLMDKARREDRELFVKHCIKGWEGIKDRAGNEVPFTPEAVAEFLAAIPDYLFDDFRAWLNEPINFTDISDDDDDDDIELAEDEQEPTLGNS